MDMQISDAQPSISGNGGHTAGCLPEEPSPELKELFQNAMNHGRESAGGHSDDPVGPEAHSHGADSLEDVLASLFPRRETEHDGKARNGSPQDGLFSHTETETGNPEERNALDHERNGMDSEHSLQENSLAGTALTSGLFGGMTSPLASLARSEAAQDSGRPQALAPDDVERIADRILVGTSQNGGNEVRISLNEKMIPGTEIIVSHDADGALSVRMTTTNANSMQVLASSAGMLRESLEAKENTPVTVTVSDGSPREDGDQRRESRGKFQYDPFDEMNRNNG